MTATSQPEIEEPNAGIAVAWWRDLRSIVTPIGWRNHRFRFNVLFNGTILAEPGLPRNELLPGNERTARWRGLGVQLAVIPSENAEIRMPLPTSVTHADGSVHQCWDEREAPLLKSEWFQDGLVLREAVFAHAATAGRLDDADDRLVAWARLSIEQTCSGLPLPSRYGFALKVNAPHVSGSMETEDNIRFHPERSAYPRGLVPDPDGAIGPAGWRLCEEDGTIRLGVSTTSSCSVRFMPATPTELDALLWLELSADPGASVDLLVPILPSDPDTFDEELALGFDAALADAEAHWSQAPISAARIETGERLIDTAIRRSLQLADVLTETTSEQRTIMLTSSLSYPVVWSTLAASTCAMFLDVLGRHEVVDRFLEIYREAQGTLAPPSSALDRHPGYLGTPKEVAAIDWLSDHGAVLWAACEHALLTDDDAFIDRWLPAILAACGFIRDARKTKVTGAADGIMPPAVPGDQLVEYQSVWTDAWTHKGLARAVRLLHRLHHPSADELAAEADDYRQRLQELLSARAEEMPRWSSGSGEVHPLIPVSLGGDAAVAAAEARHAFYLDGGPMILVFGELLDPADSLMRSAVLWHRVGPQTRYYRDDSSPWQVPCLRHEISSCEPYCSWNAFHSWRLGDRNRFLKAMYSLFAGGLSRQTYVSWETRGGESANILSAVLAAYLARLAVVDDELVDRELHLFRLVPLAWLPPGRRLHYERLPTRFGPVTVGATLDSDGQTLRVAFEPRFRRVPDKVLLHVPPLEPLSTVLVNGVPVDWDAAARRTQINWD